MDLENIKLEELSLNELEDLQKSLSVETERLYLSQIALKIAINSVYGAVASDKFEYSNSDIGNAITANSRFYIRTMSENIEKFLQAKEKSDTKYIIYNDTDSAYVRCPSDLRNADDVDNFVNDKVQKVIDFSSQKIESLFNALNRGSLKAKREAIFEKSLFVSKKRYALKIIDDEGIRLPEPEIKAHGLDVIKNSTPIFCKKMLKEGIKIILDKSEIELKKWVQDVETEFRKQPIYNISKFISVNNLDYKIGDKGIPINSRGALMMNLYLSQKPSQTQQNILSGNKANLVYLREPNPFRSNVILFDDESFMEDFREFVDFDTNFEKFFKIPLSDMCGINDFTIYENLWEF